MADKPRKSGSFSKLVSDYLEIHRNKEWTTELNVEGLQANTYGRVFKFLKYFNEDYSINHIHYGSVSVSKILPNNFDFSDGSLPNAVILKFDQEVTVGSTTTKPTLMIKRAMFEETPSAHVLAESIKKALHDPNYSDHMWCHFFGEITEQEVLFTDKKSGEEASFMTLKVEPRAMDMVELVIRQSD